MNRKLLIGLNAVLVPAFIVLFVAITGIERDGAQQAARAEALQTARLIMASAIAVREYTVDQVKPMIETKYSFSPLTVASFAATQTLAKVRKQFPDYHYREATLNPTNPLDRAEDWEADIVRHFREKPTETEFVSQRVAITGETMVVAQPMRIGNSACLDCHSTPDRAPHEMTAMYTSGGGYNWQLNEIVGAQIVTVPMAQMQAGTGNTTIPAWGLGGGLAVIWALVNLGLVLMLRRSAKAAGGSAVQG